MIFFSFVNFQSFFDTDEIPIISNEDNEIAPPLPPPRIDSLPTIPTSVSAHELVARNNYDGNNYEERIRNSHERPLPPLPPNEDGSLERVDESLGILLKIIRKFHKHYEFLFFRNFMFNR